MTEYWITIQVQVPATDVEQASDIGKLLVKLIKDESIYKLEAEVSEIEDTGVGA